MNVVNDRRPDAVRVHRITRCFCHMSEACSLVWSVLVLLFRSRVSLEAELDFRQGQPFRVTQMSISRLLWTQSRQLASTGPSVRQDALQVMAQARDDTRLRHNDSAG